jgi:2-iminobutanoate/2-iminopropanoate deaminase
MPEWLRKQTGLHTGYRRLKRMNRVFSGAAPNPIGPYSQAIEAGGVIYCSGQIGVNSSTGKLVEGGVEAQTTQALKNLQAVLEEAGAELRSVVKVTVLLQNMSDFGAFNATYGHIMQQAKHEGSPMPARTTFAAAGLPLGALVEIDCIALQILRKRMRDEEQQAPGTVT